MPIPNHCINCDKIATVMNGSTPYCSRCYLKEVMNVKRRPSKKIIKTMRKR